MESHFIGIGLLRTVLLKEGPAPEFCCIAGNTAGGNSKNCFWFLNPRSLKTDGRRNCILKVMVSDIIIIESSLFVCVFVNEIIIIIVIIINDNAILCVCWRDLNLNLGISNLYAPGTLMMIQHLHSWPQGHDDHDDNFHSSNHDTLTPWLVWWWPKWAP